jgi:hypothetical protein
MQWQHAKMCASMKEPGAAPSRSAAFTVGRFTKRLPVHESAERLIRQLVRGSAIPFLQSQLKDGDPEHWNIFGQHLNPLKQGLGENVVCWHLGMYCIGMNASWWRMR